MKWLEQQQISSFSGGPGPGHFWDFGSSPAPESAILKQISAQLRKTNLFSDFASGAKHSPSSSSDQVLFRIEIPDFAEIWVNWISNVFRKVFESKCWGNFLKHFEEVLGALEYRIDWAGGKWND